MDVAAQQAAAAGDAAARGAAAVAGTAAVGKARAADAAAASAKMTQCVAAGAADAAARGAGAAAGTAQGAADAAASAASVPADLPDDEAALSRTRTLESKAAELGVAASTPMAAAPAIGAAPVAVVVETPQRSSRSCRMCRWPMRSHDRGAWSVAAAGRDDVWENRPLHPVGAAVSRTIRSNSTVALIAPVWRAQHWWRQAVDGCTEWCILLLSSQWRFLFHTLWKACSMAGRSTSRLTFWIG